MLTLSMSTASSYFGEFFSKPLEDGPAILEIGGMSMTSRVADWGRDVVEPIEHARFFEEGGVELATNLTNSLAPQVLWLHTTDADFNFIDKARSVLHQQLSRGGVAVLDGDLQDVSWDANAFKEEFSSYRVTFEQGQTGSEITLRPAEEGQRSAVDQEAFVQDVVPPEAAAPASDPRGASAISFDPEVPQHVGAALARLHQNLGHPENRDLTRHLRYAGADQAVLKASKSLKCQTCARCKRPAAPKPATLPSLLDFNQMVSLDVVHVFDSQRVRHELLSVIDHSTTFHLVKRIQGHSSADFEAGFVDLWGRVFGPPKTIFADLETGLQAGLSRYAEFCGSKLRAAAGQAHWQVGNVERHGRWYQEMLQKVVDEQSVTEADIDLAVVSTCAAKNELRRKHGFSPSMAVFGREPRYPEELEGGHDDELFMEILSSDRQRQREVALRTAARVAFFQTRQDSKFRRALIRRARVHRGGFVIGSRSEGPRMAAGEAQELSWAKKVEISGSVLEINDSFNNRIARADLEKLLGMEPDDPEAYTNGDEDEDGNEEDMEYEFDFTDLEPEAPEADEGKERGHQREADRVDLPPPPVPKRVRRKGPGEHLQTAMMLKRCLTERSREKQREKELPWHCIPPELHGEFKRAEQKQVQDHYDHSALTPLTLAESDKIRASIPGDRILTSRFAYKDKNYARRKVDAAIPWLSPADKEEMSALKDALSAVLPVDEWLDNLFEYLVQMAISADEVTIDQELYASGRLFTVDIHKDQHDLDPATREQTIDNMSAIGALSWLASQTRPDLQAGVSMAQQLQRQPLVEDLKFTNSLVKKAQTHRSECLRLKPIDLEDFEILAYHDDELDGLIENDPFRNKERKAKRAASKVASQFGVLIALADRKCTFGEEGHASVLEWRSSSVKRVCRSTFAAETMACTEGVETGQYVRSFFCSLLQGKLLKVEDLQGQHLRCLSALGYRSRGSETESELGEYNRRHKSAQAAKSST
ncbi:unnamed protein product, partial [Symbiodinium pilosum]